jgi:hypothetical protein
LERGRDIYQSHENLWSVNVFVDRAVDADRREVVVARAAQLLGIGHWDHASLPTSPWRLATRRIAKAHGLSGDQERELEQKVLNPTRPILDGWTFTDVSREVERVARELGLIRGRSDAVDSPVVDLSAVVQELLVRADAMAAPVPLDRVAAVLGIEVREDENMPGSEDGRLVEMLPPDSPDQLPVVYLNAHKASTRKRFTLAHEIGHFHIDNVPEYAAAARGTGSTSQRERLMNAFAGELLMPAALLEPFITEHGEDVSAVAARFGVSEAAARRQLEDRRS